MIDYEILIYRKKDLTIRYFDFRVNASFFTGFDIGFNIVEFTDFLLGWTTIDIARDDTKPGDSDVLEESKFEEPDQ